MKKTLVALGLFLLSTPVSAQINAGFVSGIWFSQDPVFADRPVRIYVALQNQSKDDLSAKLEFYDNDKLIAAKEISVISGRLIESWTDQTFSKGDHQIRVEIVDAQSSGVGEEPKKAVLSSSTFEKEVFVDLDTDNDGVGDEQDEDDDNDFLPDDQEEKEGTDPKNPDTDQDGLLDGRDSQPTSSGGTEVEPRTQRASSPLESARRITEQIDESTSPITTRLIELLEERKGQLAGASTENQESESSSVKTQTALIDLGIFILKNWLWLLLVLVALYLYRKFRRWRRG